MRWQRLQCVHCNEMALHCAVRYPCLALWSASSIHRVHPFSGMCWSVGAVPMTHRPALCHWDQSKTAVRTIVWTTLWRLVKHHHQFMGVECEHHHQPHHQAVKTGCGAAWMSYLRLQMFEPLKSWGGLPLTWLCHFLLGGLYLVRWTDCLFFLPPSCRLLSWFGSSCCSISSETKETAINTLYGGGYQ